VAAAVVARTEVVAAAERPIALELARQEMDRLELDRLELARLELDRLGEQRRAQLERARSAAEELAGSVPAPLRQARQLPKARRKKGKTCWWAGWLRHTACRRS
jgi:hypothetical protein